MIPPVLLNDWHPVAQSESLTEGQLKAVRLLDERVVLWRTNNGVVALNGTVQSEDMRVRATDVARGVKGVREVVNNLRVQAS